MKSRKIWGVVWDQFRFDLSSLLKCTLFGLIWEAAKKSSSLNGQVIKKGGGVKGLAIMEKDFLLNLLFHHSNGY